MHSTEAGGNAVPAFLTKLWKIVEDPKCDDLICWGMNGTSFIIRNQARFAKELLPLYFKHNNMASFIRQLNMYGFRKVVNIEQGGLRSDKDEMEFQHLYFLKGHQYFLDLIKRKVPTGKAPEEGKGKSDLVNNMLADMKQLKGKQESMDSKLSNMKRENEALWREVANLRQKHIKQQQIVNKLIQFLLSLVQPNRSLGLKRKLPLMINDSSTHTLDSKAPRLGCRLPFENEEIPDASITSPDSDEIIKVSGPVIHDVTDTLDDENNILTNDASLITPAAEMDDDAPVMPDSIVINDPVFDLGETSTLIHIPEQGDPDSIVMLDPETIVIETPVSDLENVITTIDDPVENLNSTAKEIIDHVETKEPSKLEQVSPSLLLKAEVPGCSNISVIDDVANIDSIKDAIKDLKEFKSRTKEESSSLMGTSLSNIHIDGLPLENFIAIPSENEEDSSNKERSSTLSTTDAMVPISDYKFKKDMSDDVETIQHELESLKELLSGSGYSLDVSTLLGLFNPDDPLPSTSLSTQDILGDKNEISGTELIQYNPSLMELADDDSEFFDPTNSKSQTGEYETILFDNVESILPDNVINEESLATPDPLLSMPSNSLGSRKKIRSKKNP